MTALMASEQAIARQEAKMRRLDEQIGRAMTRRADEGDRLAAMIDRRNRLMSKAMDLPVPAVTLSVADTDKRGASK